MGPAKDTHDAKSVIKRGLEGTIREKMALRKNIFGQKRGSAKTISGKKSGRAIAGPPTTALSSDNNARMKALRQ